MVYDAYLIFGCERDYSEFEIDGLKIDSIPAINQIHERVYENYLRDKHQSDDIDK